MSSTYPRGMAFPFRFEAAGGVKKAFGDDKIKCNLRALVKSATNERLIRKKVGSIGYKKLFRNIHEVGDDILEALIFESIVSNESRITVRSVKVYREEDLSGMTTKVKVVYTRKNSTVLESADITLE